MKSILLLCALLACSCAPRAIPVSGVPTAPPRAVPAAPAAQAAARSASATGAVSAKLESRVEDLQQKATGLRKGINAAVTEADRLRQQKTASEKEIDALWQMLAGHEAKVRDLFAEAEAETLRMQRDDLAASLQAATADTHRLRGLLAQSERRAAVGSYLRGWVIVGAIALGLLVTGWVLLRIYSPPFLRSTI